MNSDKIYEKVCLLKDLCEEQTNTLQEINQLLNEWAYQLEQGIAEEITNA